MKLLSNEGQTWLALDAARILESSLDGGENNSLRVGASPWLTPALAQRVAREGRLSELDALAHNPLCPAGVLELMADTYLVEGHPCAPTVFSALSSHTRLPYAAWPDTAAGHEQRPGSEDAPERVVADAVAALHAHPDGPVAVLRHPHLSLDTLRSLAALGVDSINRHLLRHPALDHRTAMDIFAQQVPDFTQSSGLLCATRWVSHPKADLSWCDALVARALAPGKDSDLYDASFEAAAAALRNPHLSPASVGRLAVASTRHTLKALSHPNCPATAISAVLNYRPSLLQLAAIAQRGDNTPAILTQLLVPVLRQRLHAIGWHDILLPHVTQADQARVALTLAHSWDGSLGELLEVSTGVTQPSPLAPY